VVAHTVQRSDGLTVRFCDTCGHGEVEILPDVSTLYADHYFQTGSDSQSGYADYSYVAEHGLRWAASLGRLLRSGGRVLDIGCADGRLARMFPDVYECYGIEPNETMAERARQSGVQIIASDALDATALNSHRGSFDLVFAVAVFEHLPDFREAVKNTLAYLKPDGLLIFEVPLIIGDTDIWFRSSLEHIHYPTSQSLRNLFDNFLSATLGGAPVDIADYGWTYVGVASKSRSTGDIAAARFTELTTAPLDKLPPAEVEFRWLFDLIHAGRVSEETIRLCSAVNLCAYPRPLIERIVNLWSASQYRLDALKGYLQEVEAARDWHSAESSKRDELILTQQATLDRQRTMFGQYRTAMTLQHAALEQVEQSLSWRILGTLRRAGALLNPRRKRTP
jgi:SAM-dependent methyltransferase